MSRSTINDTQWNESRKGKNEIKVIISTGYVFQWNIVIKREQIKLFHLIIMTKGMVTKDENVEVQILWLIINFGNLVKRWSLR